MVDLAPLHQLGCVKGFIHKVLVNKTVQPVRQKLKCLLLSIDKEVSVDSTAYFKLAPWLWHGNVEGDSDCVRTCVSPTRVSSWTVILSFRRTSSQHWLVLHTTTKST